MAGGFNGMPLGSFSGRGADFQPFQFILEQRRLAAQAEAQRKQQAAAQQQSFVMALMAKKQQEAELAQQAQQFQASQQARAAEKQMARNNSAPSRIVSVRRSRHSWSCGSSANSVPQPRKATGTRGTAGLVAKAENRRALRLNVHVGNSPRSRTTVPSVLGDP